MIQLVFILAETEYMAFGLSGSDTKSQMEGADVAIAYMDGTRGFATDYNITAKAPVSKYLQLEFTVSIEFFYKSALILFKCAKVLGQYRGVCKDDLVGGLDSNQLYTASRENGIAIVTYRRTLISCKSCIKIIRSLCVAMELN